MSKGIVTPSIRLARPDDIPAMAGMLGQLFAIEADFCADPATQSKGLTSLLQSASAKAWVADHQGRAVGMMTLQTLVSTAEGGPVGLIEDLVVSSEWRGRGLGRRLMLTAEAWAREHGLRRLQLLADRENSPALDFYSRKGWESTRLIALRKLMP